MLLLLTRSGFALNSQLVRLSVRVNPRLFCFCSDRHHHRHHHHHHRKEKRREGGAFRWSAAADDDDDDAG